MNVVVISPERDRVDEHEIVDALFRAGLQRLHVRKPHASRDELAHWLTRVPEAWRNRLVLHQHHELAAEFAVGGLHWRDEAGRVIRNAPLTADDSRRVEDNAPYLTSRSCHDLDSLHVAIGAYDSVFFGPVFASISKPGYEPNAAALDAVSEWLRRRPDSLPRTQVLAIGGITAENAARAAALGFDGVALLGAIWQTKDPVAAFEAVLLTCRAGSPDPAGSGRSTDGGIRRSRSTSQSLGGVSVR